jgi:hypothetical protein
MEIESTSELHLHQTMEALGLSPEVLFLYNDLYMEFYGIPKDKEFDKLTFKNAFKVLGPFITKSGSQFTQMLQQQRQQLCGI